MKTFLTFLLLLSVAGNAYLFMYPKEKTIIKQELPKEEIEKIHEISAICGLKAETLEQESVLSTLSDIKTTLNNNTTTCEISTFSQEECCVPHTLY